MEEALNVRVQRSIRSDLRQYGRILELPEDFPQELIDAELSDKVKSGLVKAIKRVPASGYDREGGPSGAGGEGGAIGAARKRGRLSMRVPSAVSIFGGSAAGSHTANVTRAMPGPCMLEHVRLWTLDLEHAANALREVGLSICRLPSVGPFEGDIQVFDYNDPAMMLGGVSSHETHLYDQREDTAVGYIPRTMYEFFPRIPIPFNVFYLNYSVANTNGVSNTYCEASFGPIEVEAVRGEKPISSGDIRFSRTPASRAPALVPTPVEMRFKTYSDIKTFEALGNKIVWSSVHNTGDPSASIGVTAIVKI